MKVMISGGGTGGHIYPALALLDTLKQRHPNLEVLYIGTENGLEADLVPRAACRSNRFESPGSNGRCRSTTSRQPIGSFNRS